MYWNIKGAVLNLSGATLTWNGVELELTRNELRILGAFSQAGRPVSRDAIMTKLWESDSFVDDNTLTVNITRLRKKLEATEALWILLSREKVWATWCEVFMELLRAYLKQTKIFSLPLFLRWLHRQQWSACTSFPLEAAIYLAVLWLGAGAAAFLYGYVRYRQKAQTLCLVEKAPEINLDRLDETTDEVELLYREIIRKLDGMRMEVETDRHRSLEEMTDYYTMWAHQIKTPIFALRLPLQEEPERNRESLAQLFRIEQYVEMVLGYLRTEDMSADLKLARSSLDRIIREQIHKYAGIFVAKKTLVVL